MRLVDWIAVFLILLLALRAALRLRKTKGQGCGGGCQGCAMSDQCEIPQKAEDEEKAETVQPPGSKAPR